ncbi:MAG TPA: PPK2 family polyphosphate kinase [Thermoplasmata archaeon]|nr:PPK2 family polyphosphate kinase [Thermoplasmata archaeon]
MGEGSKFRIRPGERVRLDRSDPDDTSAVHGSKRTALADGAKLARRLEHLQELLWADHRRSILMVLMAIDAGGKDGTIRHVFEGVNPQGVRVAHFRVPTEEEGAHDFLWRIHPHTPGKGEIAIFNRSHYEDVFVPRVEKLAPRRVWHRRYRMINEFERTLSLEGTTVLKFFLHISEAEQKSRLRERLKDPTKHWKFSEADLPTLKLWPQYQAAFEEILRKTSTRWAPWYLVPANEKWFRDWVVSNVLVEALDEMALSWPPLPAAWKNVEIR